MLTLPCILLTLERSKKVLEEATAMSPKSADHNANTGSFIMIRI